MKEVRHKRAFSFYKVIVCANLAIVTESRFSVCRVEGWITKGQQETFGDDGHVH